jgi:DNA polymerase V
MGLQLIYRAGFALAKAGVMLLDLRDEGFEQGELDLQETPPLHTSRAQHPQALMQALDHLNQRYGRGTLMLASSGSSTKKKVWAMRQERLTPRYTTAWADMPVARA